MNLSNLFEGKHEAIDSFALMGSPLPLIAISAAYLLFVLKVGPNFMRNRKPYNLTNITRLYNVLQVILCFWFVVEAELHGYTLNHTLRCVVGKVLGTEKEAFVIGWYFLILRLAEYVETVFFVLRKKQSQVTFLHVYHHLSVVALYWLFLKYNADPMETVTVLINSCVHIIMYSYYFLSSFKSLARITKFVKPILTAIQIVQLVIILAHTAVAIMPGCNGSKLFYVQFINIAFLIFLFCKFYRKSYVKKEN